MIITLAFLVISALILWFVIGSKGQWGIKAAIISLALYFCLSIGMSLENLAGWPTDQQLPEKFTVHWIVVEEPNKKTGEEGFIYIWATNTGVYYKEDGRDDWRTLLLSLQNYDPTKPRAYKLSYSMDLHEQSQRAMDKIRAGGKVGGERGDGDGSGDGKGKTSGGKKGQSGNNGGGSLSGFSGIIFHELPPSKLPEK